MLAAMLYWGMVQAGTAAIAISLPHLRGLFAGESPRVWMRKVRERAPLSFALRSRFEGYERTGARESWDSKAWSGDGGVKRVGEEEYLARPESSLRGQRMERGWLGRDDVV